MWWWLLAALVVLASLVVLGTALLSAWRAVKGLSRAVGSAGERVAVASEDLNAGLATMQAATAERPPPARPASRPAAADSAALAARVRAGRSR